MFQIQAQDVVLEKEEEGHRIILYAVNKTDVAQEVTLHVNLEHVEANKAMPIIEVVPGDARIQLVSLTPEVLKPWSYKTRYSYQEYVPEIAEPIVTNAELESDVPSTTPIEEVDGIREDTPAPQPVVQKEVEPRGQPDVTEHQTGIRPGVPVVSNAGKPGTKDILLPPRYPDEEPIPARYLTHRAASEDKQQNTTAVQEKPGIVVFGQDACPRCEKTVKFLDEHSIMYTYHNVTDDDRKGQLMTKQLYKGGFTGGQVIMPVIVVGDETYFSIRELDVFLEATFLKS